MPAKTVDILIAGAGPVGLTLAVACRKHGLSFRIIEKLPAASPYSKALAVWTGTLELLAALGLAEMFIANGLQFHGLHVNDQGKHVGFIPTDEGVESRYSWPIILPQNRTEALLAAHLRAQGVVVEREVELSGMDAGEDAVRCQLRKADGTKEELTVSYVAGCDGARSFVRHQLPVKFEGETIDANFILADAKIEGGCPGQCEVFVSFSPIGPVAIFPVDPGVWRIFSSRPTMENKEPPSLAEMQTHMDAAGLSKWKLRDPSWLSYFQVNERVVNRMRLGRIFLCGDAAHIHSPAGGQGMNTGMQDAYNLGWKLKLLVEGVANPEAVCESFQDERHTVAKAVVGGTAKLIRQALLKNPLLMKLRGVAASFLTKMPAVQRFAAGKLSELSIFYADSPLVSNAGAWPKGAGGIEPGYRMRDAGVHTLAGAPASLWEQTFAPDYTLVFFSGRHPAPHREEIAAELAEVATALRPRINLVGVWHGYTPPAGAGGLKWFRDVTAGAHERFGVGAEPAWYLVRPDQYVAARTQPANAPALRKALQPVAVL